MTDILGAATEEPMRRVYRLADKTVAHFTPAEIGMIRKMDLSSALAWLIVNKPELDQEAIDDVLAMVKSLGHEGAGIYPSSHFERFPYQPKFVAAAWLCGASWGQLAALFGITRQTAMRKVDRILPVANRQQLRNPRELDYGELIRMRNAHLALCDKGPHIVDKLHPIQLAKLLERVVLEQEDTLDVARRVG
jgi:hypothetical protein